MDITVAVVTFNAAKHIRNCLESLMNLAPHSGALELLVVDGCSTDGTQKIVGEFKPRIRLVENPGRTIASNRNVALAEARHPYIAFTDADCIVQPTWIEVLEKAMTYSLRTDETTAGVGGGNIPPESATPFSEALGIAIGSFLGSLGSVQGKVFSEKRRVASLAGLNVLYKKQALLEMGGFDEMLANMNEDTDINRRLTKKGYSLWYVPGAEVRHAVRPGLGAWCRAMFAYGDGRGRIMRKHRTLFSPAYAGALLFIPIMTAATAGAPAHPWLLLVWLYVPLMFAAAALVSFKKNIIAAGIVGLILIGTHFCYAAGLWRGLLKGYPRSRPRNN